MTALWRSGLALVVGLLVVAITMSAAEADGGDGGDDFIQWLIHLSAGSLKEGSV